MRKHYDQKNWRYSFQTFVRFWFFLSYLNITVCTIFFIKTNFDLFLNFFLTKNRLNNNNQLKHLPAPLLYNDFASNPHDFITRTLWETLVLSVGIAGLHYIGKEETTL